MNEAMMNNYGAVAQNFGTQYENVQFDQQANSFVQTMAEEETFADTTAETQSNTKARKVTMKDRIKKWEPGVMKYAGIGGLFAMVITSLVFVLDALMSAEQGNVGGIILSVISVGTLLAQIVAYIAGRISFWKDYVKQEETYDYKKNVGCIILFAISSIGIWVVSPILMGLGVWMSYNKYSKEGLEGKELWMTVLVDFSVAVMIAFAIKLALSVAGTLFSIIMFVLAMALFVMFLPLIILAVRFVVAHS